MPFVLGLAVPSAASHHRMCVNFSHENEGGCSFGPGVCAALQFSLRLMHLKTGPARNSQHFAGEVQKFRSNSTHTPGRSTMQILFVCSFDSCSFHGSAFVISLSRQKEQSRYKLCREREEKELHRRVLVKAVYTKWVYKYLQPALILSNTRGRFLIPNWKWNCIFTATHFTLSLYSHCYGFYCTKLKFHAIKVCDNGSETKVSTTKATFHFVYFSQYLSPCCSLQRW